MVHVKTSTRALSRRERGAETRARIVSEAHRLFSEQGFEATTMQAVADAVGVAVQTVYFNFRTKPRLFAAVAETVVLGDRPPDRWRERPWGVRILRSSDPREVLAAFVEGDLEIKSRLAPFERAVGAGAPMDPESVAGRERGRDEFFGAVVDRLVGMDALRPGLSPDHALDVIRVVNTLEAYRELTERRGWSDPAWKDWLTDLLAVQLLGATPSVISASDWAGKSRRQSVRTSRERA
jgi:AcrR family transcriptional regulator